MRPLLQTCNWTLVPLNERTGILLLNKGRHTKKDPHSGKEGESLEGKGSYREGKLKEAPFLKQAVDKKRESN